MTKEELEFLKDLQRELKEQDTDGQSAPHFWGIIEDEKQVVPDGFGDCIEVIDGTCEDAESFTSEEYLNEPWETVDKDDIYEVINFANRFLERNAEIFEIKKTIQISDRTGCFLTKRAAKKHIELNGYHYNNPKTYAMTAWRNPEFEKFMDIFENLDLTELEKIVK